MTLVVGRRVLLGAVLACGTYILCSPQLWAPGSKVAVSCSVDGSVSEYVARWISSATYSYRRHWTAVRCQIRSPAALHPEDRRRDRWALNFVLTL